jgi:hypothetical protein
MAKAARSNRTFVAGEVFEIPVKSHGFVALIVVRPPDAADPMQACVCYCTLRPQADAVRADSIQSPATWGNGWVGLVECKALRSGFWRHAGSIRSFDPRQWPVPPLRSSDEPPFSLEHHNPTRCMQVLACESCEPDVGYRFPEYDVVSGVRKFERGIKDCIENEPPGFFGHRVAAVAMNPEAIDLWARARPRQNPAGRAGLPHTPERPKSSPNVMPGDVVAVPLPSGGFGVLVAARREPKHPRNGWTIWFGLQARFDHPPELREIGDLVVTRAITIDRALDFSLAPCRWQRIGSIADFSSDAWPVLPVAFPLGLRSDPIPSFEVEDFKDWTKVNRESRSPRFAELAAESQQLRSYASPLSVEHSLDNRLCGRNDRLRDIEADWSMTPERANLWRDIQREWRTWK